jgi:hypothetical protein
MEGRKKRSKPRYGEGHQVGKQNCGPEAPTSLRRQVAKQDAQQVRVVVRRACHERDNPKAFNVCDVRPDPFDFAQDRPVEGQREWGSETH